MKKDSVPEADGTKQLRDRSQSSDIDWEKSGDWPKRTRGKHRAVKRGEPWALFWKRDPFGWCLRSYYPPSFLLEELMRTDALIFRIEKEDVVDAFVGGFVVVPFKGKNESS
jgi:hypothetical protein